MQLKQAPRTSARTVAPKKARKTSGDARSRIRAAGLRATASRIATLDVLDAADAPLSHAAVSKTLCERGFDRATVYRNLTDFVAAGLLLRTHIGRTWSFEIANVHEGNHPHFVCDTCGDISCLFSVDVDVAFQGKVPQALTNSRYTLQLSGRCDKCAQA